MKNGRPLSELKEEYKINGFCVVCDKGFQYPYGRHFIKGATHEGTCSKVCEAKYMEIKPKLSPPEAVCSSMSAP